MGNSNVSKGTMPFYIFWSIILLLAIIVTVIVISSVFPNFRFSFLKLRHFATDSTNLATQSHTDSEQFSNSQSEVHASPSHSMNSDAAVHEKNVPSMSSDTDFTDIPNGINDDDGEDKKKSLFTQAQFTSAPKFLSRDGRHFLAGSLGVLGQFPRDFQDSDFFAEFMEQYPLSASVPVRIVIDIGWNDLLSFADIDKVLLPTSKKSLLPPVEIPPLKILDIRVSVLSNFLQENTHIARAMNSFIKKSIRARFDDHDLSADILTNILSEAQQSLAVAYVSHGYQDIVLLSSHKE